jgi:hypothetical protein
MAKYSAIKVMESTNIDLTADIRKLFSEDNLNSIVKQFKTLPWQEEALFNKYNDKDFEWHGEYENEEGDISSISKSLYHLFHKELTIYSESILETLNHVEIVYKDEPGTFYNLCDRVIKDLLLIRTTKINSHPFLIRYFNQVQIDLLNIEGKIRKYCPQFTPQRQFTNKKTKNLKTGFQFKYPKNTDWLKRIYQKCGTSEDKFIGLETDVDDFVEAMITKDISSVSNKIYLGCETKEAVYILNKMKHLFKNLKPALIGQSGLFITKGENHLTADNFNSTHRNIKSGKVQIVDRDKIDFFFATLDSDIFRFLNQTK